MTGVWPETEIDHIDKDKTNNEISNLRLATRLVQEINKSPRKDNRYGITGVYYDGIRWVVRLQSKKCEVRRVFDNLLDCAAFRKSLEMRYGHI